jgi:hypothetical protein
VAVRSQVIEVECVEVEKSLGLFRPDLLITGRKNRQIAVEIVVTNPVSKEKAEFYRWSRISALQIDMSKRRKLTLQLLEEFLLRGSRHTSWIHNEFAAVVADRLKAEARPRGITWRKSHKRVGKVPHVDTCPCPPRSSPKHEATFANAKLDCPGCPFFVPPPNPNKIFSVLCSGHLAEKFPIPTLDEQRQHYVGDESQ